MGDDMERAAQGEGGQGSMAPGGSAAEAAGGRPEGSGPRGREAGTEGYTFELAFARLEEIVQQLEAGDAPLQDALALFEEGVRMARLCSQRLDEAETRIRVLMEGEDGSLYEAPWDGGRQGGPEGWEGID